MSDLAARIAERKRQLAAPQRAEAPAPQAAPPEAAAPSFFESILPAPRERYRRDDPEYRATVDERAQGYRDAGASGVLGKFLSGASGVLGKFLSGATFGFSDKASAGLASAIQSLPALIDERDFVDTFQTEYDTTIDAIRAANDDFTADNPILGVGAELGGALVGGSALMRLGSGAIAWTVGKVAPRVAQGLTRTAPTTLGRAAQNVALSAGFGGLYAAGNDMNIAENAAFGGALGPVGAAAVRGGAAAIRNAPAMTGAAVGAGAAGLAGADRDTQIGVAAGAAALASRPGQRALQAAANRLTGRTPPVRSAPASTAPREPSGGGPDTPPSSGALGAAPDAPPSGALRSNGAAASPAAPREKPPLPTVDAGDLTIASEPPRPGFFGAMRAAHDRMRAAAEARRARMAELARDAAASPGGNLSDDAARELAALRAENKILVDQLNRTRRAMEQAPEVQQPRPAAPAAPAAQMPRPPAPPAAREVDMASGAAAPPQAPLRSIAAPEARPMAPPPTSEERAAVQAHNALRPPAVDPARAVFDEAQDATRRINALEERVLSLGNFRGVRDKASKIARAEEEDPGILDAAAYSTGRERGKDLARVDRGLDLSDQDRQIPDLLFMRKQELNKTISAMDALGERLSRSANIEAPEVQGALQRLNALRDEAVRLRDAKYPGGRKLLPSDAARLQVDDGAAAAGRGAQALDDIRADVRDTLNRLGLQDVDFELVTDDVMRAITGTSARGASVQGGTKLLLNIDRMRPDTVTHEVIHSFRTMGLIKDNEFNALLNAAMNGKGGEKARTLRQLPEYRDLAQPDFDEEVVAQYFGSRLGNAVAGRKQSNTLAARIAARVVSVGRELRGALSRGGIDPDLVVDRMASGRVGGRTSPNRTVRAFERAGGNVEEVVSLYAARAGTAAADVPALAAQAGRLLREGDVNAAVLEIARATRRPAAEIRREIMGDMSEGVLNQGSTQRASFATFANPGTVAERARFDRAQEFGITLSKGQQTRTMTDQGLEQGYRDGSYGQGAESVMKRFDERQRQQIDKATDDIAEELGFGASSTNPYDAAAEVVAGVTRRRAARLAKARIKYGRVEEEGKAVQFADGESLATSIRAALDDQALAYGAKAQAVLRLAERTAERAQAAGRRMSFADFDAIRSKALAAERTALGTPDGREVRIAVDAIDKWFDDAIERNAVSVETGGERLLNYLKDARQYYRKYREAFFPAKGQESVQKQAASIIEKMADGNFTPEQVVKDIIGINNVGATAKSQATIRKLKEILNYGNRKAPAREWQAIRGAAFRMLVEKPAHRISFTPEILAARIDAFLNGQGQGVARILFEPHELAKIRRFRDALRDASTDKGARDPLGVVGGMGRMAQQLGQSIFGAFAFASVGDNIGGTPLAMLGAALGAGAGSPVSRFIRTQMGERAASAAVAGARRAPSPVAEGAINWAAAMARLGAATTGAAHMPPAR